ncbi:MAG: Hsp20/alpha crystallin family protein [Chthoniobacterales bacterium]|nr:Hsp20/alpha crystallin family protein [Chthoniobacterales bacterium]
MKLIRYNPVAKDLWTTFDRLNSLRDLFDSALALAASAPLGYREWFPAMDVREDDHAVTVELEVAGMKKEDFDISLERDVLTISGERKAERSENTGESFRNERFFGKFSRSITLPTAVDATKVTATYNDGILTVTLPKAEEAKPKKIEVGVS